MDLQTGGFLVTKRCLTMVQNEEGTRQEMGLCRLGSLCKCNPLAMPPGPMSVAPPPPVLENDFWDQYTKNLEEINMDRWYEDVCSLSAISRFAGGNDIETARDLLVGVLEKVPGLSVTLQEFPIPEHDKVGHNIIASLTGTEYPDMVLVVGGHYDSIAFDAFANAPGALFLILFSLLEALSTMPRGVQLS